MGIALPQLAPASEDRVSGALVIDGSLKFDGRSGGNHEYGHLKRTSSGASGGGTFTISWWAKRGGMRDDWQYMIAGTNGSLWGVGFPGSSGQRDSLTLFNGTHQYTSARFRDNSGWYHIVLSVDSDDGPRLWVNGELQSNTNTNASWNLNNDMYIGKWVDSGTAHNYDGYLAQYTCIDGLELGPSYFAYTDPLTGAWRPKKFVAEGTTVNDGTVWSNSSSDPNNVKASGAASQLFNGNLSAGGVVLNKTTTSSNNWYEALTGVSIPCNNSVAFYSANGASTATMRINGDDNLKVEAQTTTNGWWALNFEGTITKIELAYLDGSGSSNTYYGIQIDGVTLIDSTTQNLAFGNAGFYLPLDGNTPIGEDLSGNGNNWTPEGFGGSADITKATGALPILNTGNGGTVARPGVFGSEVSRRIAVTVSNATGNNKYYFDTVLNPTLSLIRGATITFDTGDSSNNSHPFKLSSTNADSSGGTEYTDGVKYYINGSSVSGSDYVSNYANNGGGTGFRGIKWTIPHNVSTTYYYCTQHQGMGNNGRLNSTTDETKADPYAWKCVLALPLVGDDNDVSNRINSGSTTKTTTPNGDAAASSTSSNFYSGSFAFDGTGDYVSSPYNSDYDFSNGEFTVEAWFNTTQTGGYPGGVNRWQNANTQCWDLRASTTDKSDKAVFVYNDGSVRFLESGRNVNDGNWHHLAVTRSGNTLNFFVDGVKTASDSYSGTINQGSNTELRIGYNDTTYYNGKIQDVRIYKGVAKYTSNFIPASSNPDILPDTPSGVATKSKLKKITDGAVAFDGASDNLSVPDHADLDFGTGAFTIECFLYMNSYGSSGSYPSFVSKYTNSLSWILRARNTGKLIWYSSTGGGTNNESSTNPMVLKKWLHIAAVREGTGSNQMKVYVDGKLHLTVTDANDYDDSNALCIGSQNTGNTNVIDGFVSNVRIVKGTAVYTSEFTPPTRTLTNVTNTKLLCCQSPTSATAAAVIPTGSITANGDTAATNFNPFTDDINTIRGQEGAYATLNPIDKGSAVTLTDGNLTFSKGSSTWANSGVRGTIGVSSGKWFWEITKNSTTSYSMYGVAVSAASFSEDYGAPNNETWTYISDSGNKFGDSDGGSGASYGATFTSGDVIGVALNMDAGTLVFYKNGLSQGTAFSTLSGKTIFPWIDLNASGDKAIANFGQKPFKFPPPDGFQPLTASTVRPDTVVARPDKFVKTVLYRGTGAEKTLDVGFQPDFSYFSIRNATGYIKYWFDSVRGATKYLATSETQSSNAEGTDAQTLKSFNSNGVTIGTNGQMNESASNTWASWHWKAGGNAGVFNKDDVGYATAAAAGLTAGDVAATGSSVGTKQGFSIISYTGAGGSTAEIPHGLEQSPNFVIIKNRDGGSSGSAGGWYCVYHDDFPNKSVLSFGTFAPNSSTWNNHGKVTGTTSTVVQVADGDESTPRWWTHDSGSDYIMYSWHNVPGLQKFGSYTGNGNADGPLIDLGFRPGIIWLKENGNAGNWVLIDSTRSQINPTANTVWMNRNLAENHTDINPDTSYNNMDILSNGFKMRSSSTGTNRSGGTYIYCAWAEAPQFNLYGAQSNAR